MPLLNPAGLWALAVLVPFILAYLIRPRPEELTIPSLMFFLRQNQKFRQNAFLRKLLQSVLFLIQLALLVMLAVAVAEPFIEVPYSVESANTVLVIDGSASMQARSGQKTRFEEAVSAAKRNMGGRVSIVLAENIPVTLLKDGSFREANAILSRLRCKATSSNIGDAMLLAEDILKDKKGRIVVLSDFLQTDGSDPLVAKRELAAKGNQVEFIDFSSTAENVGLVDMELTKQTAKVFVKNFNDREEMVEVALVKGTEKLGSREISLLPNSLESLVFDTPAGLSRIELAADDDFAADNTIHISAPEKMQVEVLLITNKDKSSLMAALDASDDIRLSVSHPPLGHMVDGQQVEFMDFDVIILADVGAVGEKEGLLRGRFKDMEDYLAMGGSVIIAGQEDLGGIATTDMSRKIYSDIMPVDITGNGNNTRLCFRIFNQFTDQFEENSCPINLNSFLKARAKDDAIVIATADDNSPAIAYRDNVYYYGIIDEKSDFPTSSSYPIFWSKLVKFIVKTEDISDYNFRTGDMLVVKEQSIRTPGSSIKTDKLMLDEQGIYETSDRKIAANLLDAKESEVDRDAELIEDDMSFETRKEQKMKKLDIDVYLIIAAGALIVLEIIYIKQRGDL